MENRQNHLLTYEGLADYDKLIKEYIPVAPGKGEDSIVMGGNTGNEVTGDRSIALGKNNKVNNDDSIAIGKGLKINYVERQETVSAFQTKEDKLVLQSANLQVGDKFKIKIDEEIYPTIYTINEAQYDAYDAYTLSPNLEMTFTEDTKITLIMLSESFSQIVLGKYNVSQDNLLFSIGNGTSNSDRKSVFKIPALNSGHISFNRYSNRDGVDTTTTFNIAPGQISIWDGKDKTAISHLFIQREADRIVDSVDKITDNNAWSFYVNASGGNKWSGHSARLQISPHEVLVGNLVSEGAATFKTGANFNSGSPCFFNGYTYFRAYSQFDDKLHVNGELNTYCPVNFNGGFGNVVFDGVKPQFKNGFHVLGGTSSNIQGSLTVQNLYTGNDGIKSENGSVTLKNLTIPSGGTVSISSQIDAVGGIKIPVSSDGVSYPGTTHGLYLLCFSVGGVRYRMPFFWEGLETQLPCLGRNLGEAVPAYVSASGYVYYGYINNETKQQAFTYASDVKWFLLMQQR